MLFEKKDEIENNKVLLSKAIGHKLFLMKIIEKELLRINLLITNIFVLYFRFKFILVDCNIFPKIFTMFFNSLNLNIHVRLDFINICKYIFGCGYF